MEETKEVNGPVKNKVRKNFTAKEFMSAVFNNFVINAIFFGIFLIVLQVVANEYLNGILLTLATLLTIYFVITKIFVGAVKETFKNGRIYKSEIDNVVHSINKSLSVLMIITIGLDIFRFVNGYGQASMYNVKNLYIITLLIGIVFTIITYAIIMFACRKKFFEECKNLENVVEQ